MLRDTPLFLLVSADGNLDRLHQDPESRPGLVAQDSGQGGIRLLGRGGFGFLVDQKVRDQAEIAFGENLVCCFAEQQWTLAAEGEEVVHDPLVGTDLGGYRILSRLGNGSVGVVYRALQVNLEREIALKILDPKAAKSSPLAVASFKREAVAAGRLSHPNLVQVYDVGFERGLHFFAMELVPGGDLEMLLEQHGALPWRDALVHVLDCAEALRFAREHHLVHRDIKPENLMLTLDGRTKLADLGMAATRGMVEKQSAGGTPHFMAPECVSGEHIDFRSDLYSLGCTLFRLLSNATPFDGESVRDILRCHRDSPIPSLKALGIDAPTGVQDLIEWLMAKDPDARPNNIDELLDGIHNLLDVKKSNGLLLGVVVMAVIAVGVSLFSMLNSEDPQVVEVEAPGAQQARDRNALLQAELAFTQAINAPEGKLRTLALQGFVAAHPHSAFRQQAQDEIARLRNLPIVTEQETVTTEADPQPADLAAADQLAQLETTLLELLEQQRYGHAQTALAGSPLEASSLEPLWNRVESLGNSAFAEWAQQHAEFLQAQQWQEALAVRQHFAESLEGVIRGAEGLQQQLAGMEHALELAQQAVLQRAFDSTRLTAVLVLQKQVFSAAEKMEFAAAQTALEQAGAACEHAGLRVALLARASLFADAQRVMDAIYARLDGSTQIDVTEPLDGKRAFASKADSDGVQLFVQVRGERVARTDPWRAFCTPQGLADFLVQVLGPEIEADNSRFSLLLLVAEVELARELTSWGEHPPSAVRAAQTAALVEGWLTILHNTPAPATATVQAEILALQQLLDLCESLADADSYEALLFARGLSMEFSLLSAWSSSGASAWGFKP